jgi:hypothetical protein
VRGGHLKIENWNLFGIWNLEFADFGEHGYEGL